MSICILRVIRHHCYTWGRLASQLKNELCKYLRYTLTMDYGQRRTRKYSFKEPKIEGLMSLIDKIESPENFWKKYGIIIPLMKTKMKDVFLSTLVQFYDPLYHCFTFLDYQLVPTFEEYSYLFGQPITSVVTITVLEEGPKYHEIAA